MNRKLMVNFTGLRGEALKALHKYVQEKLFAIGYVWQGDSKGEVKNTEGTVLLLNYGTAKSILYSNAPHLYEEVCVCFFANTALESFFSAAIKALIVERKEVLRGLEVTITREKIDINVTSLVEKVRKDAEQIQRETFGA